MGSAADCRRLPRRYATESEVMQLESKASRWAGANQVLANLLLDVPRQRTNRDGVPDPQQQPLRPVGEPWEFGVGVLNGHQGVLDGNNVALWNRTNLEGQLAAVLFEQPRPASRVEHLVGAAVQSRKHPGFINVFLGEDHTDEASLQNVLETEEHRVFPESATRHQVREDGTGIGGIRPPGG